MPGTTRLFGLILIALGIFSYVGTGRTSVTALIPAFFGAVLLVCAIVARASEGARKHAMHAAVAVGMVGLLGALARALPAALRGEVSRPAVVAQLVMGALLLIYVALGVRSFVEARRGRSGR
jgi:uncharacterized membrane protein